MNYVVACYFGPRGYLDSAYEARPACYLAEQIRSLKRLEHDLSQITIVVAGDTKPLSEIDIPSKIRQAKVVVVQRDNVGMSYGSFSDAFDRYENDFGHFIFTEDDYIFTHDSFDLLLLDELESRSKCGLLCAAAWKHVLGDSRNVATVSVSIASTYAIRGAANTRGGHLPYRTSPGYFHGYDSQIDFGFCFQDAGYTVEDWLCRWATAYRDGHGRGLKTHWFSRKIDEYTNAYNVESDLTRRALVVPVQCLGKDLMIFNGTGIGIGGTISRNGEIIPWSSHESRSR